MADRIDKYNATNGQLSVYYLTANQYDQLKEKNLIQDHALYLTPDENDSSGSYFTKEDIDDDYSESDDTVPSSRLVYNLLKRIERLEKYLGISEPDNPLDPVDPSSEPTRTFVVTEA